MFNNTQQPKPKPPCPVCQLIRRTVFLMIGVGNFCLLCVFTRAAPKRWFRIITKIFDDRERNHRHSGRCRGQADFRRDNTLPAEISTLTFGHSSIDEFSSVKTKETPNNQIAAAYLTQVIQAFHRYNLRESQENRCHKAVARDLLDFLPNKDIRQD